MQFLKRNVPVIIAFLIGIMMVFQYYVPSKSSIKFGDDMNIWVEIIGAFALLIGIDSLIHNHIAKIRRRQPGFGYSWVVFVSMAIMTFAGLRWGGVENTDGPFFWMYMNIEMPMQATVFSILAFYIATAAYRAFRAKTPEATVLLIAAAIVMLARVPLGEGITHGLPASVSFFKIDHIGDWLLNVPNVAGFRAVNFGVALGVISTSLRIIFGIERTYMGGGD